MAETYKKVREITGKPGVQPNVDELLDKYISKDNVMYSDRNQNINRRKKLESLSAEVN